MTIMLSAQDQAILDDVAARNGVEHIAEYFSRPVAKQFPITKYAYAFKVAHQLCHRPEGTRVSVIEPISL